MVNTISGQDINKGNAPQHDPDAPIPKSKGLLSNVTKRDVFSYMMMPGIIPQIKELGRGGFGYLAFLMAQIYLMVRILPANHAYTNPSNIGRFSVRQVIASAANHVKLDRQHIDQAIIFFGILIGVAFLILQLLALLLLVLTGDAWAQTGIFTTEFPKEDIAFHMMREVFGIPDMFGPLENGQQTIHKALHVMLRFYNSVILIIAIIVFIYYVIVVVGETAQSGTPFGQRFSHIYAPIRLVIAIGLLVPLTHGLNGAQYVTLQAAKLGSGFASNGWAKITNNLDNPLGADNTTLIAETRAPDSLGLIEFMSTVVTCDILHQVEEPQRKIRPFCSRKIDNPTATDFLLCESADDMVQAAKDIGAGDLQITFGDVSDVLELRPVCGRITIPIVVPITDQTKPGDLGNLHKEYILAVHSLWMNFELRAMATEFAHKRSLAIIKREKFSVTNKKFDHNFQKDEIELLKSSIDAKLKEHYINARENADFGMKDETKQLGWGGAGTWYNRIAQINGAYVAVAMSMPIPEKWPQIMEEFLETKQKNDGFTSRCLAYDPNIANNKEAYFQNNPRGTYYMATLNDVYKFWNCDKKNTNNFFLDSLSAVFGLNGLMNIRQRADTGETDSNGDPIMVEVHPLAKLSALGRSLIESSIRNMGFAMFGSSVGGMTGVLSPHAGASLDAASQMFVAIATIGLSIGFITYYILPFYPFIYFFFAVGGWVKGIFEAMVGAPLWALAHLRIDGDGLPGKSAMNGYLLIFEIFLRPILTIFGLLGGMSVFTALAAMMNEIFDIAVLNSAGRDLKQEAGQFGFNFYIVDIFFFTCVYAVILHIMAVSSFKMITHVPNNILRWLGQNVDAFNDKAEDPTGNLSQFAAIGANQFGGKIAGASTDLAKAAGGVPGGILGLSKTQ